MYSLEGHSSGIKKKIDVQIGEKLQNNENGIDDLIEYLDTIYEIDEMCDAWQKYKSFQKVSRKNRTVKRLWRLLRSSKENILSLKLRDAHTLIQCWRSDY